MIKSRMWETCPKMFDETLMLALEAQLKRTSGRLNRNEYEVFKRTEVLLGELYRKIMSRETNKLIK